MRVISARAIALATCPLLAACGVLLGIDPDSPPPPPADGGAMTDEGGAPAEAGADVSPAIDAADACAMPATCAPELVTKMGGQILRLVASGNALYVAVAGTQPTVFRVDLASRGMPLDLDPHAAVPEAFRGDSNIAVDPSGVVFWGTPNGLRRRDADAGADAADDAGLTSMIELGSPVAGVRIANGRLHYTVAGPSGGGSNSGHLASCALPLCTDVQQILLTPEPVDVIAIGANRWWLGTDASLATLSFHSESGVIGPTQPTPSRMVTDGTRIFWSAADALRMFTVATKQLVELLSVDAGATRVNGIALDTDGTLYVTQDKALKRCAIAADRCTLTELAATGSDALDVAVDATFVYWGNRDGSILRLRKR